MMEYAILVCLIATVAALGIQTLGQNVSAAFSKAGAGVSCAGRGPGEGCAPAPTRE